MTRRPFVAAAALLSFSAALLHAQQAPARHDTTVRQLDTVSVVAQRRAASVFDIPLAVTLLGRERLADRRGVSLDEALAQVPGVLALSRAGGTDVRLNIRGFGARGAGDRSNAGTTRGVRVLLDGLPETEPDGRTAMDLVDLAAADGIEVIRSNASSLWGNAAGGVVNVTTARDVDRPFVTAQSMVGDFGLRRQIVRGGAPMGGGSLVVTATTTSLDGWRAHSDGERSLASLAVRAPVGDRTRVGVFATGARNFYHIPGPLTQAEVEADPMQANATYRQRDERRYNRLGRLGATIDHEVNASNGISAALFVNPKYLQRSERGTFRDFTRYHTGGNVVYRNTARVGGLGSQLALGVDEAYQDGAILFYSLTAEGTRGSTLRDNKREGANNFGAFVHEELQLTERLALSAGARWDAISYYNENFITPKLSGKKTFSRLTPKAGVNYRLSSAHSIYASVGGGVEAPAGNETDPVGTYGQDTVLALNPLLAPIRSTTYELGTKRVLAFGAGPGTTTLAYDAALYHTDVRNEIVPYRGGRFYFSAGQVRRTGAELGLDVRSARGLSLQGAFTYADNRYVDYTVDSVHYQRPGQTADFAGNRAVGMPDVLYNVTAGLEPAPLRWARVELGVRGQGRYFADDANAVVVPAFTTLHATLALTRGVSLGSGVALRGFVTVNNLTNRRFIESAFLNPDVVNGVPVAFEPGLPRNVVVSLSLGARR